MLKRFLRLDAGDLVGAVLDLLPLAVQVERLAEQQPGDVAASARCSPTRVASPLGKPAKPSVPLEAGAAGDLRVEDDLAALPGPHVEEEGAGGRLLVLHRSRGAVRPVVGSVEGEVALVNESALGVDAVPRPGRGILREEADRLLFGLLHLLRRRPFGRGVLHARLRRRRLRVEDVQRLAGREAGDQRLRSGRGLVRHGVFRRRLVRRGSSPRAAPGSTPRR